jgi:phage terminase large subunit GpA-like protein
VPRFSAGVYNNWLGYIIHHVPGPALMVQPTVEMAKRTSKQRLAPMIAESPVLADRVKDPRARDSGNTQLAKEYPGGILVITGANSAVGLRSMPVRYLFLDEVDGYDHDVDGEGDPVELAVKRTATFARNRKVFIVSTPTVKGFSRIETAFERSDQRYFNVPCPECGTLQPIVWGNIRWENRDPSTAALVCEHCDAQIPEYKKTWLLENGRWVASDEGDGKTVGFHLSALYSPLGWYSWEQAVRDFLQAKKAGAEALKTWSNTVLGETWEDAGESVDEHALLAKREKYPAEVPAGALVLCAGVDVQDDRLEVAVYGYGPGEESWAIDYRVLWGDPGQQALWKQLDDILMTGTYKSEHGHRMGISATCIDSGGHHTQAVYDYVKPRQSHRIFAIKGMAGFGRPIMSSPSRKRTGRNRRQVNLFTVGVDPAKGLLYSRLKLTEKGPGYCHFPATEDFDEEFFAQLTAEKCVTRYVKGFPKREWIKTRSRNEALDCTVYALAALYNLNPKWDALVARMKKQQDGEEPQEDKPKRAPTQGRRRRKSWVNSF